MAQGQSVDVADLLDDWVVRWNIAVNPYWNQVVCFGLPALYGAWRLESWLDGLLILGALRYVLCLHGTWCVNSVAHKWGYRPRRPNTPPADSLVTSVLVLIFYIRCPQISLSFLGVLQ